MLQPLRLLQPNYKVGSFLWFSLSYLWRELKEHTYKNVCMHVPIYMHTSIIIHFFHQCNSATIYNVALIYFNVCKIFS